MSRRHFTVRVGCQIADLAHVVAGAGEPQFVQVVVNGQVLACGAGYGKVVEGGVEFEITRTMTEAEQEREDKRREVLEGRLRPRPTTIPGGGRIK